MSLRLILLSSAAVAVAACGAPDRETSQRRSQAQAGQTAAQATITAQQIEQGAIQTAAPRPPQSSDDGSSMISTPARADPGLVRLQILLDRTAYSPGVIDGLAGENTRQAVAAWRKANGLSGDVADQAMLDRLAGADAQPVMTTYTLTQADVSGPFSPPPSGDLAAQAQSGSHYSSAREAVAEKFHLTEDLLQALNPGVDFSRAGQQITVPAVADNEIGDVSRIEVNKADRSVTAFDSAGKILAYYPATIGSGDNPTPSGTLKVNGVAPEPNYTYDPDRLSYGSGEKVIVPAGPNNPVGSVWIDLSKDTYGIHGSPDPSKIAKTASHGCVRLTNWDAEQLAKAVKPGVTVRFV